MDEEDYIAVAKKKFDAGDTWLAIHFINSGLTIDPCNTTLKILLEKYKAYEEKEDLMKRNTIEMRLKILTLEKDVYIPNPDEIKQNEHLQEMMYDFEFQFDLAYLFKDCSDTDHLSEAEKIMCEIKKEVWEKKRVVKPKTEQAKAKTVEENIPDYRSIVTVKGTQEDVKQCIAKAQEAFDKGNLDKAKRLLNKAERICPTQNARQLLKQVRAAAEARVEQHMSSEQAEIQGAVVEDIKEEDIETAKERMPVQENIVLEPQNIINARKCLKLSDEALKSDNLVKAVRMLEKAKRLDPDVNIDEKLDEIRNAIEKGKRDKEAKMREAAERDRKAKLRDAAKEEGEAKMTKDAKRNREASTKKATEREDKEFSQVNQVIDNDLYLACDFVHRAEKACEEGRWADAEELLLVAKKLDKSLDLGQRLYDVRAKLAEERSATANSKDMENEKSNKCDQEICQDYLDRAKAAYDAGDLYGAQRIIDEGKTNLPSFNWDPHMAYVVRAIMSSKSSTSVNDPVPRNEPDNSIHDVQSAMKNVKEATVDNYSERYEDTKKNMQIVYDVYPNNALKKVIKVVEQKTPFHENTNVETKFSCLQDDMDKKAFNEKQKEPKNKAQKTNKARDDPYDFDNERHGNENIDNFNRNYTLANELLKKARTCMSRNDCEEAKSLVLEAESKVSTVSGKSLLKEINEAIEKSNLSSRRVENTKYPSKKKHAEMLVHKAEEDICKGNLNAAKEMIVSAEQLCPTARTKILEKYIDNLEKIKASTSSTDNVNSYKLTQDNTALANQQESKECVTIAQCAFRNGNYDKAERMLLKSLRICKSQTVEEFLRLVQNERVQKSNNIPSTSTDPDVQNLNQDQSLDETWKEYEKCLKIATEATFKQDYYRAERFLEKAIRIHATDEANTSLEKIKQVIADETVRKQTEERKRLKQEEIAKVAELNMKLALEAVHDKKYFEAKRYADRAIELQPTKNNIELLEDIEANIEKERGIKKNLNAKSVPNSYTSKAKEHIDKGNWNAAEGYLQETMKERPTRDTDTLNVYKDYLGARLAKIRHEVDAKRRNSEDLKENEYQAYQMVSKALNEENFEKAEKLLMQAHDTHPTVYVGQLLMEAKEVKNKRGKWLIDNTCSIC